MTPTTTGPALADSETTAPADRDTPARRSGFSPASSGVAVAVVDRTGRMAPTDVNWLGECVRRAVTIACSLTGVSLGADAPSGELRLVVTDDARMSEAHQRFSAVAGTTDVLTFDLAEGNSARLGRFDADVLLCLDEAERAGSRHGVAARVELLLYALHAALHCLGFDDHSDADFDAMHQLEDRVLNELGIGAVFARGAPPSEDEDAR